MTNIPKIVLEDNRSEQELISSLRMASELGLPASSMPNLSLERFAEIQSDETGKLGVYCSPRTTRRSVDLDAKKEYEWLENIDSTNSLRVLGSSSRTGSALSLNSECTARSIGLLSNDSSSESNNSIAEKFADSSLDKQPQLRRYMSHPEKDCESPEMGVTRSVQSCVNLKGEQEATGSAHMLSNDITAKKLALLPSDSTDELVGDPNSEKISKFADPSKSHIVSYKRGEKCLREGRIRRWLEDMDK
ncbi:hypothetical protein LOTGIDRAFT_163327 [Lottia gigantea]|uniref:Uncharacterized protein n=1 Tax=Lottia gigantea TaxID=225164 RepID=V4AE37_LOTGI|nr:hypothetical protein LOTGIDRAFT_163327 [Lottia gigantea]ESO91601.1 hypothetical protein LOTGIDRAFT_163327 [Lottia gigantea]